MTEAEISPRIMSEMRDVLYEIGYYFAQDATEEAVVRKIEKHFGTVEQYMRHHGHVEG